MKALKLQMLQIFQRSFLMISLSLWTVPGFAAQFALVTAEKAIIFSDEQMSSAIGYAKKGKKIKVGDVARNKGQVYPLIVSGRMGWIRVVDVTTERESTDSSRLTAERFQKRSTKSNATTALYSVSYMQFASQITLDKQNGTIANNDPITWSGVSLRGESRLSENWDLEVVMNFLTAQKDEEKFAMFEIGMGGSYDIFSAGDLTLRIDGQGLVIPFTTYELGSLYRKRGYGLTMGGGLNLGYRFGRNFGLEVYGGFFYTKLTGLDAPEPYEPINPSFLGTRVGLGLTYQL